jgi:hypothetical protein
MSFYENIYYKRAENEHASFKLLWSYDKWHLHGDLCVNMIKTREDCSAVFTHQNLKVCL